MDFDGTSDTVGSYVLEIWHELEPVFQAVESGYRDVDLGVAVCFRCLPDAIGRKTRRWYDRAENRLCLDLVVSAERYERLSKEEQRFDLSHVFYRYLAGSLRRYRFPGLDVDAFLADLRSWLRGIGWLSEPWEIYLCADPPPGEPGGGRDECACLRCILDTSG